MTHVGPAPLGSSATPAPGSSFVEWGSVLAGAVLAAAISFVLLTFGAAIGLSATSPWPNSGASAGFGVALCPTDLFGPANRSVHGWWVRSRPHAVALA